MHTIQCTLYVCMYFFIINKHAIYALPCVVEYQYRTKCMDSFSQLYMYTLQNMYPMFGFGLCRLLVFLAVATSQPENLMFSVFTNKDKSKHGSS